MHSASVCHCLTIDNYGYY
uniref:Uncharacterized protein n=1 Tax=Arundo donax TaxID=35708 RepID=A0A0A9HLY7_ARUDO